MGIKTTAASIAAVLLAAGALAQSAGFSFAGLAPRVISPNGDGINDVAFLRFCNPADSEVSGKVYSLFGSEIAELGPRAQGLGACAAGSPANWSQYLSWNGRMHGAASRSGIYVYRIRVENRTYAGTVLVAR